MTKLRKHNGCAVCLELSLDLRLHRTQNPGRRDLSRDGTLFMPTNECLSNSSQEKTLIPLAMSIWIKSDRIEDPICPRSCTLTGTKLSAASMEQAENPGKLGPDARARSRTAVLPLSR